MPKPLMKFQLGNPNGGANYRSGRRAEIKLSGRTIATRTSGTHSCGTRS